MSKRPSHRALDDALLALDASEAEVEALTRAMSEGERVPTPASLRERVLASTARAHRFPDMEAQVASLLDVDATTAALFLLAVDTPEAWSEGPGPGVTLFHVDGGPRVQDAVTGFVRLERDANFPEHEHLGDEVVLVLQGALEDSLGRRVEAGEAASMPAHSVHSFRVAGKRPLIYLAVIHAGVRIGDAMILPGDPRG